MKPLDEERVTENKNERAKASMLYKLLAVLRPLRVVKSSCQCSQCFQLVDMAGHTTTFQGYGAFSRGHSGEPLIHRNTTTTKSRSGSEGQ